MSGAPLIAGGAKVETMRIFFSIRPSAAGG